jgi:short-subunit dehydrogenase
MNNKKFFLHGGSSLISKFLIEKFKDDFDEMYIFSRNTEKTKEIIDFNNYKEKKFFFFENDLEDIEMTLKDINKLPNDLSGVFWVTGVTGDPDKEYENRKHLEKNLNINLLNPLICISLISKKIIKNNKSFICVFSSVAGLRGRKKRLYYSSAKSGLSVFLSGLRQKFNDKIKIFTVVPGYISTNSFTEKAPKFLISSPKQCAEIVYKNIKKNKEIIYVNYLWKVIMGTISLIPEKIFKKLNF